METPAARRRADARSVAITGLTTLAWYAVPDVVGPRWARALAKTGVLAGGLGLGLALTAEGRSAVDGVREARGELRDLRDLARRVEALPAEDGDPDLDGADLDDADLDADLVDAEADGAERDAARDLEGDSAEPEDNVLLGDAELADADPLPDPVVAGAAAAGAVALAVTVAVAGEKWAYRRGERWRAQGRRLPHTRVGLILGALAAVATVLDPSISGFAPAADEAPAS
ncbi:hypothetical protein [Isoptericola sp. NPDC057391]|uniref:hypothetical protein n=1 Tax=Isoptericola sp. NPDC057391 TaxID=3346117 RepID=UPI00363BE882